MPVTSQQNRIGFRNETELFTVQKKKGHGVANLYVSVLLYLISDTMGFFFFFSFNVFKMTKIQAHHYLIHFGGL